MKCYQPCIDFEAEAKKAEEERRNGKFSKYVSMADTTYSAVGGGRERKIISIDFHSITHPFCNLEIDAILIRSLIWGNGFLTVGSSYLSSVTSELVLGKLKYLIIIHDPPREDWVRSEDSPNHMIQRAHIGRDLRALKGLKELRVLVAVVPSGRWDLEIVKSVFEEEVEWAYKSLPAEVRRPRVRVLEDEQTAVRGIRSGAINLEA